MMKNLRKLFDPKALLVTMGLMAGSTVVSTAQAPYCSITYSQGSSGWGYTQLTIGSYTQSPTSTAAYNNYLAQNVPMVAGVSTPVSITTVGWVSMGIAVDFNNDNDFEDAGETLYLPGYIGSSSTDVYTGSITVPPSVISGSYRMRVWTRLANGGGANNGVVPCGTYGYGRYADYTMVVTNNATCLAPSNLASVPTATGAALTWVASTSTPANYRWKVVADGANPVTAPAVATTATGTTTGTSVTATGLSPATAYDAYVKSLCSASDSSVWTLVNDFTTLCDGTPATGVASSSVTSVCPTISFNLVLTGVTPAPGITYQWQSATVAAGPYTNITGATSTTYATSQTVSTYYRCVVTCASSTLTSTSNTVNVAMSLPTACYCTPTYTNGCSNGARITSFSTTGATISNITNLNTDCANSGGYSNYTTMTVAGVQTTTFNYVVVVGSYTGGVKIWADWNQDGVFDATTEEVAASTAQIAIGGTFAGTATIPATALTGSTRLRVRVVEGSTSFNPCANYGYGETEDYTINVVPATGVCVSPVNLAVGGITATAANVTFAPPPVGNTPTNYIYELRTDGTLPGSGALGLVANATVTSSPINFTTLSPASSYVFYIRTFCSVGDSSVWASVPFSTTFDTLTPVSLSQFNADVIANGIGTALSSTTNDVDGASFALIAADFQLTSTSALPTYAVPNNRIIQNGLRKYRLANYTGNNSLRQTLAQTSGTVRFIAPKRANKVYIMGVSGSAVSNFNAIVHFADGTTQTQAMNFADWYTSNSQVVVSGLGRINRTNNNIEGTLTGGPRFHDSAIVISTANRNKQIDSIVIQRTGTVAGVSNVMAVSIVPNVNQSCKLPGYLSITNATCMGGLLAWQGNGINTNYEISYGAIGTQANSGTIVPITGGSTGANTYQWTNTSATNTLQLYVRASCGAGSYSDWVGPLEITLPTTTVTPTFTLPSDICAGATAPVLPAVSNNMVSGTWSPTTVSNTTSGTYTFTPTSNVGCALPVTVSIGVSSQVTPAFSQIPPICSGSTAPSLPTTSTNGYAGTWSPATINNITSGTYTFTPTGSSACLNNATMSITVKPLSQEMDLVTICSDELPYVWNNITVTNGGTSAATYVTPAANGCDSIVTLNLQVVNNTNPSITVSANPGSSVNVTQSVTFTATLNDAAGSNPTIQWNKSGTVIPGATSLTWTGVAGTDFLNGDVISASALGFNDCAAVQNANSNQIEMSVSMSIGNLPVPDNFKLYPNPTVNSITIEGLERGSQFRVIDALGRILMSHDVNASANVDFDMSTLGSGMYILLFQDQNGRQWTQKVNKL